MLYYDNNRISPIFLLCKTRALVSLERYCFKSVTLNENDSRACVSTRLARRTLRGQRDLSASLGPHAGVAQAAGVPRATLPTHPRHFFFFFFYSLVNSCRRRSHPDSGEPGSETRERSSRSSTKPWESAATAPAAKTRGKGPQAPQRGLRGAGGGASMTPSYPRKDRHTGVGGTVGEGDLHSPPATRSGIPNLTSHPVPSRLTSGNSRERDRKSRPSRAKAGGGGTAKLRPKLFRYRRVGGWWGSVVLRNGSELAAVSSRRGRKVFVQRSSGPAQLEVLRSLRWLVLRCRKPPRRGQYFIQRKRSGERDRRSTFMPRPSTLVSWRRCMGGAESAWLPEPFLVAPEKVPDQRT